MATNSSEQDTEDEFDSNGALVSGVATTSIDDRSPIPTTIPNPTSPGANRSLTPLPHVSPQHSPGISKRKLRCDPGSSVGVYRLKEDKIKQEISTPSSEMAGRPDNTIFYTCGGCGESGTHHLGLEYRLVKTATVMEVGTQTGCDEISWDPVKMEITDPFYYDTTVTNSAASPKIGGQESGEEEINSFGDNMMSGNSSEGDEWIPQSLSRKPTSLKARTRQSSVLPPQSEPTTSNPGSRWATARIKRAKTQEFGLSSPPEISSQPREGQEDSPRRERPNHTRKSLKRNSSGVNCPKASYQCVFQGCSVLKLSEEDLFEHVRIDHADRKHRCNVCPIAFTSAISLAKHNLVHSEDEPRELYAQIKTANPKKMFQCDVCPKIFNTSRQLTRHHQTHYGFKQYTDKFDAHVNASHVETQNVGTHSCEKRFVCFNCGKIFAQSSNRNIHEISCSNKQN